MEFKAVGVTLRDRKIAEWIGEWKGVADILFDITRNGPAQVSYDVQITDGLLDWGEAFVCCGHEISL